MRGEEREMWPPHPNPLPRHTLQMKVVSRAGEREQNLVTAYISDAIAHDAERRTTMVASGCLLREDINLIHTPKDSADETQSRQSCSP